jgi:hypothetical protein
MIFASMIEIVIMPRFGTGANASPLTADPPTADSEGSRPRIRDDVAQHSDLISLGVPR